MNFQDYVKSKRKPNGRVKADIASRWQTRIVAGGLSDLGEVGAEQYLNNHPATGSVKCIDIANLAEDKGLSKVALGFWERAYQIDYPQDAREYFRTKSDEALDNLITSSNRLLESLKPKVKLPEIDGEEDNYTCTICGHSGSFLLGSRTIKCDGCGETISLWKVPDGFSDEIKIVQDFPEGMMPGELVTSQPTDAQHDREYYITNPNFWAQPKRDGHKVVVFATADAIWVQSRSLKLRSDMPMKMQEAFKAVAKSLGSFVIEGEMFHLDWAGHEHMTAATAQAVNNAAIAGVQARTMFAPFGCLFIESAPNGGKIQTFKRQQVEVADMICRKAYDLGFRMIDRMPTYRTEEEKRQLVARQQEDGREGEIFFRPDMIMRPGKITSRKDPFFDGYVRCKYREGTEDDKPLIVVVTDVLPSRADGHFIGGIEVAKVVIKEGGNEWLESIGRIGTGYTRQDQQDILERWNECQASGKVMKIKVTTQGWSAYGNLRHGSFAGIVEE